MNNDNLNFNYDYEASAKLINDETNVTQPNVLKDLFAILLQLAIFLFIFYIFIFVTSGLILKNLSIEKQIQLENALAGIVTFADEQNRENEKDENILRLENIRDMIKEQDRDFPITSNLEIKIIPEEYKNAMCYPNGNIYVTKPLYDELTDDEMATFVIAHEMAHYKNKDHLLGLRRNLAGGLVILTISVFSGNKEISKLTKGILSLSDLKYSRNAEEKADDYAKNTLKKLYGNTSGGIRALEVLADEDNSGFDIDILSTHPDINKRIKKLK